MPDDMRLDDTQDASPAEQSTLPEEFLSLSGKTQDRIKKLVEMKNQALEEKQRMEAEITSLRNQAPVYQPQQVAPQRPNASEEERIALERMKSLGVLTKDELEAERARMRREIEDERAQRLLEEAHAKAESKYSSDEYPAYDRKEVEAFMRERGIYDPETAYEKLYRDEVISIEAKKLGGSSKTQPYSERTKSRISSSEPWTIDRIRSRMQQPDGNQWYRNNMEKVDRIIKAAQESKE